MLHIPLFPLLAGWAAPDFSPGPWALVWSMAAALGCGIVLGFEREKRQKPAGIKTLSLVALGSAALTNMTLALLPAVEQFDLAGADPVRLISGIAGGVGFLGAGAIIQSRGSVRGLTTAATIWLAAAMGVACGLSYYLMVTVLAGLALLTLTVVRAIEHELVRDEDDHDN